MRRSRSWVAVLLGLLVVACLVPNAEATRTLPIAVTGAFEPGPPAAPALDLLAEPEIPGETFGLFSGDDLSLFAALSLLDASEIERVTAENRFRLFADSSEISHLVERMWRQKTALPASTSAWECNVLAPRDLGQVCVDLFFQGLWTDPSTGLSYARNRWYDARTASWLSEDPLGAVDSPNLYAFVRWGPHMGRDPMGEACINVWSEECRIEWGRDIDFVSDVGIEYAKGFSGTVGGGVAYGLTLGVGPRMYDEYQAGNVNSFSDSVQVAKDGITNTATLGAFDRVDEVIVNQGGGGGDLAVDTVLENTGAHDYSAAWDAAKAGDWETAAERGSAGFGKTSATFLAFVGIKMKIQGKISPKPRISTTTRGTLSTVEARKWYLGQEARILDEIDPNLPLRERAMQAFSRRNELRTQARDLMTDRKLAEKLMREEPNMTLQDIVLHKYKVKGLTGDALWQDILDSSKKSRTSVNKKLGLE